MGDNIKFDQREVGCDCGNRMNLAPGSLRANQLSTFKIFSNFKVTISNYITFASKLVMLKDRAQLDELTWARKCQILPFVSPEYA